MYILLDLFIIVMVYIASFNSDFDKEKLNKASLFIFICMILIIISMMF